MKRDLIQRFENPGAEYRGKPFWSWNGKLEAEELLRQIGVCRDMGFGGFFMHSRTGLRTEYLGDEWFDLINLCADEGERLGLEAWLYDEDRWPSGSAGGMATDDPQYRMKYLRLTPRPADEFAWDDSLVAAFACDLDGIDYRGAVRLSSDTPAAEIAGRTVLCFTVEEMASSTFYQGNTYLDTMNREATEHFLQLTHERYKAKCGDRLGRSIKGIFTDEPHRGMVMCGSGIPNQDSAWLVPWTPKLPDRFQEWFGYDLRDRLPEVFLRPNGERLSPVKWQFMECLQRLFLENWAVPCDEWCRRNGLILTGHILHEDTLGAQAVPCGSVMRYYEHMEYPGVDVLTEGNRAFWIVKQCASVCRQLGRPWLLSELYGCTGWQMPLEAHKSVGDWQSLLGVTLRCPHLSWYTMEAEAKRDFPASIFHQSAWYTDYPYVEDYFSRMHVVLAHGKPRCDVLVVNPVESAWAQIHVDWARWLDSIDPHVKELDSAYRDLFHWLCDAQIEFDYGDEDHIGRWGKVLETSGRPRFQLGEMAYSTIIVSGMETIRSSTVAKLKEFMSAGGQVIFAGESPTHQDGEASDAPAKLAQKALRSSFDRSAVVTAVKVAAPTTVEVVHRETGMPLTDVFVQVRDSDAGTMILAVNVNREHPTPEATLRMRGSGAVEEWDLVTGGRQRVAAQSADGWLKVDLSLPASGQALFWVGDQGDPSLPLRQALAESDSTPLEGPYAYELDEPNVLVLDRARFSLDGGEWSADLEILKADQRIRDTLGIPRRGGEMLQPWFTAKHVPPVRAQLALEFTFAVDRLPEGPVELVMEHPERFVVAVNGTILDTATDNGWWCDPCFRRLTLPDGALIEGDNVVRLEVGFHELIDLESLYLQGGFGVRIDGTRRAMVEMPETLRVGDLVEQGLPFYTGRVRYLMPAVPCGEGRAFLVTDEFEGALVRVEADGGAAQPIAWQPYETEITGLLPTDRLVVETVLTRRNVFGPLHQVPKLTAGYGPGNWISEGKSFSEGYQLIPSGLLAPPRVSWRAPVE
ncbi:MAG: hypothetical protein QM328_02215, partial [Acidobacteriota bacterium]|nr:hypothetical protein [Acidobacteriota bacterium]